MNHSQNGVCSSLSSVYCTLDLTAIHSGTYFEKGVSLILLIYQDRQMPFSFGGRQSGGLGSPVKLAEFVTPSESKNLFQLFGRVFCRIFFSVSQFGLNFYELV